LIDWLFNTYEYENLWCDEKGDIGFQVTAKNREEILALMEEAVRTDLIKINSTRTVDELFTFIINENGKVTAEKNHHDDLVMSLALAVYGFKELIDSTPIETVTKLAKNEMPAAPTKAYKTSIMGVNGQISEEDYRWLIR
jgi:hypothetical protein